MTSTLAMFALVSAAQPCTTGIKQVDPMVETSTRNGSGDPVSDVIEPIKAQSQSQTQPQAEPVPGDQATLTAAALSLPDVRMEKVLALKAAIAAGTYIVSSSDVAEKMIESLLG